MLAYTYEKTHAKSLLKPENENQSEASLSESDEEENSQKKVGKWTPEEDELLRKYAPMYDEKQWRKISNHIPGRSSIQCLHRWTKILKPGLVKGPWTAEEDQRLLTWVRTEGPTKWAQAANFIKGRSGKQCRERWFNNLSPNVKKGNWSKMEDELIFELYQKYGTSWSKIAKYLPGRTENAIKNRFYSTLRKLAADKRKLKNELPNSESVKSSENTEEAKHIPMASTPGAAAAAASLLGASSRLYKLLQDTSGIPDEQNELKESTPQEEREHGEYAETSNNDSPLKATQDANDKMKKLVAKREAKMGEQTTYGAPTRASQGEHEDNDLIFEKFLLSLDDNTEEDFLLKELDSNCDSDDVLHFDELQQKILGYCQENIQGLAEAFKNIANNDIDVSIQQDKSRHDMKIKGVPQILPRQSSNISVSKVEANAGNIYQQNIKGIKISAPIPITHIGSNKKINQIEMAPSNGSVSSRNQMLYSKKKDDGHGQGYLMMPNSGIGGHCIQLDGHDILGHMSSMESRYSSQYGEKSQGKGQKGYVKGEEVQSNHINALNNLLEKAQEVGNKNNSEGEKRMTFLFQQLHSLEDLLTSTRNELMKLEGTYNIEENKENLGKREMSEEIFIEGMKEAFGNAGYDGTMKKRKRS